MPQMTTVLSWPAGSQLEVASPVLGRSEPAEGVAQGHDSSLCGIEDHSNPSGV